MSVVCIYYIVSFRQERNNLDHKLIISYFDHIFFSKCKYLSGQFILIMPELLFSLHYFPGNFPSHNIIKSWLYTNDHLTLRNHCVLKNIVYITVNNTDNRNTKTRQYISSYCSCVISYGYDKPCILDKFKG